MAFLPRAVLLIAIPFLLLHVTLVLGGHGGHVTHSSFSFVREERGHHKVATGSYKVRRRGVRKGKLVPPPVAGSRLPDCSHACGSCSPCRLVMVSLVCSSLQEAETCPMAYKCMCNRKAYPVP